MAEAKFSKGSEEWVLFMDFWTMCQKHWLPEENDAFWERAINDANNFCKNNGDCIFARKIAMAFLDYLECKLKENPQ